MTTPDAAPSAPMHNPLTPRPGKTSTPPASWQGAWQNSWQNLGAKWSALQARERQLLSLVLGALVLLVVWSMAVSPALKTLTQSEARHAVLDQQLQRMQSLAEQARALQGQTAPQAVDSRAALKQSLAQWLDGTAQLNVSGDRATVTLQSAPPEAVAQWLLHSRQTAHTQAISAQLSRNAAGHWDGSLVLTWPSP